MSARSMSHRSDGLILKLVPAGGGQRGIKVKRRLGLVIMVMWALSFAGCAARTTAEEPPTVQPEENTAPILAEGETVTIDGVCEFHVDYVAITEHPEFYFEANTGKTYVDFCITYTQLADYIIPAGNIMEGKLIYSGQYEYDGVDMVKEEEGDSLSHAHTVKMNPSDTRQVHYFFNVSKEVQDSDRMVELNMKIRDNDYRVIVREGEKGTVPGSVDSGTSAKTSGTVTDGEVVATDNSEFYVEYSEFTKKVMPPNPGAAYNYYAAEDGKVYIDFCIAYRNMSGRTITADKVVSAKMDQAEASTVIAEDLDRHMLDYSSLVKIIPLCTEYIHCIFQVPEELENSGEQVTISFKIDGNRYTYSVR